MGMKAECHSKQYEPVPELVTDPGGSLARLPRQAAGGGMMQQKPWF